MASSWPKLVATDTWKRADATIGLSVSLILAQPPSPLQAPVSLVSSREVKRRACHSCFTSWTYGRDT